MRLSQLALLSSLVVGSAIPAVASNHARRGSTSTKLFTKRAVKTKPPLGQRNIDDLRATQIQSALIKAGYLSGEPKGHWDSETQSAMEKLQSDQGWQTKLVPDSRAIIKLGLGSSAVSGESLANQAAPLPEGQPIDLSHAAN